MIVLPIQSDKVVLGLINFSLGLEGRPREPEVINGGASVGMGLLTVGASPDGT